METQKNVFDLNTKELTWVMIKLQSGGATIE